jgi:phosphoserine phosphatase RsbU/P
LGEKANEILQKAVELKMGEGIAGWVAENRQSINIKDAQSDPRLHKEADEKTGFITRNLLCIPLLYQKETLGVINVLNCKDKPYFDTEDQEILESFADLAAVAIIRSRLLETRLKQQKMEIQMEAASKIQALFWPKVPEMGEGSHAWAVSIPAAFVGGDLFDVIPLPNGDWLVYVADVSDKGLPAALIMAALSTRIRSEVPLHEEVDKLLEAVNRDVYDLMSEEGFFATIILGKYSPHTGEMQFSLGGHFPPIWVGKNGVGQIPEMKGVSLGISPEAAYRKQVITLLPGESILFMTDGITEAENAKDELFGNQRLLEYIQKTEGPPWGESLLEAVEDWRGGRQANDDTTLMEIWRERDVK